MKTDPQLSDVTAGEILSEEYLKPMGLTQYALAKALHVPQTRISEIIRGKRKISPDTAMRLAIFFKTSSVFWLNIQVECDRRAAEELRPKLAKMIRPYKEPKKKAA